MDGTSLLARTLANLGRPPRVLVSASAIGYYGDGGDNLLTEDSPPGDGFLAEVCRLWEAATAPAAAAGIRVVLPRFAVVLSGDGGLLARIAPLVRFGLGARLGRGEQFMGWIALDDLLGVILRAIADADLAGPINAVAPQPTTNRDFMATLGRVLHRPIPFAMPAGVLRAVTGGLANELLLTSQRAQPARLKEVEFRFAFPSLESALRHELGRRSAGEAVRESMPDSPGHHPATVQQ